MMEAACYVQVNPGRSAGPAVQPIAPIMLFLGETDSDEPDTAAREAAIDLGHRMERPVLLLDLGDRASGHYQHFLAAQVLAPRAVPEPPPIGQAALYFHPLEDSTLFVSSLAPGALAPDDRFWERCLESWPSLAARLLALFGAVVIAAPSLSRSDRGLLLAARVEATILALRESHDVAARAGRLSAQVTQQGGHPVGVVLTGCDTDLIEQRAAARKWW